MRWKEMYCKHCGAAISEKSKYCQSCGKEIEEKEKSQILKSKISFALDYCKKLLLQFKSLLFTLWQRIKNDKKVAVISISVGVILIASIVTVIILCNQTESTTPDLSSTTTWNNSYDDYDTDDDEEKDYTEEELKAMAARALYSELSSKSQYSRLDLASTKFSVGTISKDGLHWVIKGTFTLYDNYGQIYEAGKKYTVTVNSYGVASCNISNYQ